jgi:hypothetical protein
MKYLSTTLQGSVGFFLVLIVQVLIVAGLSLTALWLYFKRLKENATQEADLAALGGSLMSQEAQATSVPLSSPDISRALPETAPPTLVSDSHSTQAPGVIGNESNLSELEKINLENIEKIKGLELKLLEFEVLKDEIGQISKLKAENASLKAETQQLKAQMEQSLEPATRESSENRRNDSQATESQTVAPTQTGQGANVVSLDAAPAEISQESPNAHVVQTPPAILNPEIVSPEAAVDPHLEGLLNEIEALTAESKEPSRKKA